MFMDRLEPERRQKTGITWFQRQLPESFWTLWRRFQEGPCGRLKRDLSQVLANGSSLEGCWKLLKVELEQPLVGMQDERIAAEGIKWRPT